MIVIMLMVMIVVVAVVVRMERYPFQAMRFAELLVPSGSISIVVTGAVFQSAADTLDVVVMAFLRQPHLILKTQNLFAIFAHLAIHHILPGFNLIHPVDEG